MTFISDSLQDLASDLIQGGDTCSDGRAFYIAEDREAAVTALRAIGATKDADLVEGGKGGVAEAMVVLALAAKYMKGDQ